jgi:signal transduction histidine kinase
MIQANFWNTLWMWAGRVPFRFKIIGIVVAPLLILGLTMAWWVSNELGGWLSYLLSEERVEQAMLVGMRGVVIITIFAALAGLVIASFLIWVLTRPIQYMTRVARQVKEGNLKLRAPVWARDEIGELGVTFNAMIDTLAGTQTALEESNEQLRQRNRELGILFELAQMASLYTHPDIIAGYGLDQALRISEASAGLITLLKPSGDFEISVQQNLLAGQAEAFIGLTSLRDHLTQIMAHAEPVVIPALETVPGVVKVFPTGQYASYVAVPVVTRAKVLGIVHLFYSAPISTNMRPDSTLLTVSNQLGIAIENSRLWEELRTKEQMRAQLLNKVVSAQEEERRRISRELHDETGQSLTSLLVQLKVLERAEDVEAMRQQARDLRALTAQTLEEVRRLSLDLRPAALDDLGLVPALEWYISEYSRKVGIAATFTHKCAKDVRLPREAEAIVYRVVQEALSNVARHSGATEANVRMQRDSDRVSVDVCDNGRGFDVEQTLKSPDRGLGLLGMQERLELIGGRLHVTSSPGQGATISIEVTLLPEEAHKS